MCYNNQLTSLDVSHNTALTQLACSNNQLTSLDVSHNTALTWLWCYNNQLTSLDVSAIPAIKDAVVNGTKDTSASDFDKYSSYQGTLSVDKTVTIVTDTPPEVNHTVTFDANGHGTAPAAQSVESGKPAAKPADPTETGWTFGGWYTEAACTTAFDFTTPVTADITLYAKWTKNSSGGGGGGITTQYTLTYDTNGGSAIASTKHNSGATVSLTATPTREGFTFAGWYSDAGLTNKITSIKMDGNKTIYAGWKEKENPNTGAHDCPSAHLKDVDITQWYHEGVDYVVANELMVGVAADQFAPNLTTTRAMIVTILYRLEGSPAVSGANPFDDVEAGSWYADAVAWAEANEIVEGYGNRKFGPTDPITREQMAAIMFRYSKFKGYDTSKTADLSVFTDNTTVSDWAVPAMKWAVAEELFKGVGDDLLSPTTSATRAQVATILMRYIEKTK